MAEPISPQKPSSMRAWVYSSRGAPTSVLTLSSYPTPSTPSDTELLIRVSYSALNPIGSSLMALIPSVFGTRWTAPETDFSGEVVAAGQKVADTLAKPGTKVWGLKSIPSILLDHKGTLAEYVCVNSQTVALLPKGVNLLDASGVAHAGSTALQMLEMAGVSNLDRILINGASGGVGTMLVQLAKAMGLHITATCSAESRDLVMGLGADEVIDYKTVEPSLPAYLSDTFRTTRFNAVFDCVGIQALYVASPGFLRLNGKFVSIGAMTGHVAHIRTILINTLFPPWLGGTPRTWKFVSMKPSLRNIQQLHQFLEDGKLKVVVDSVYKMGDALDVSDPALFSRHPKVFFHAFGILPHVLELIEQSGLRKASISKGERQDHH